MTSPLDTIILQFSNFFAENKHLSSFHIQPRRHNPISESTEVNGLFSIFTMDLENNKLGRLFPFDDCVVEKKEIATPEINTDNVHRYRKAHNNNLDICMSLQGKGILDMPRLEPYTGLIPGSLCPFNEAISKSRTDCGVHFYVDDYQFERVWNNTRRYIPYFVKCCCVIGPDFSQYGNMSYPMRLWNCYRNRVITSFLQHHGVSVVPNVTWSLPDSYDYSFSGIPTDSTIAINCTSVHSCNLSKYLWYKGYNEALKRLQPRHIIRYGTIMPGECTDISYYFENDRLKLLRNGR